MLSCINKNSVEFQTLKNKSGLTDFELEAYCRASIDKLGRFPYLDELPYSDSSEYLKKSIKLKKNNSTKIDNILNYTGASTIEEAVVKINNDHRDLEVDITPINNEAIVKITKRPSLYQTTDSKADIKEVNSALYLNNAIEKITKLYGIKIIPVTNADLQNSELGRFNAQAFIYQGNIYINTDSADVDAPLHELMHLFIGSIKFTNPKLYDQLVQYSMQFKGYEEMAKHFKNRTQSDINEELFVTEFAKYITNQPSALNSLSSQELEEISYNVHRLLDSILMGANSSNLYENQIYGMSMKELAQRLDSATMNNDFFERLSDAKIHRTLQNFKSELMESGKLKEYC